MSRTLKELFQQANSSQLSAERRDSDGYQQQLLELIQQWIGLKDVVTRRAVFSSNESIEDVSTADVKYLSIDYHLALLYPDLLSPAKTINIKKAILCYLHFFTNLHNYGLLGKDEELKYEKLKDRPFEIPVLHETAMLRREDKIANYKLERQLSTKLERLEQLEKDENEYQNTDEDDIRQLYLDQLRLYTIKTFDNIRVLTQELEILQHMERAPKLEETTDEREKQRAEDPTQFTEKLESINKDIMTKEGKILRPFTLLKRQDLKNKVFGTGQYLPTMTVEDFLEQELANGGMISGGGNDGEEESSDEDDMDKQDAKTYKARQWDDFTESHTKGSGNTMNRG